MNSIVHCVPDRIESNLLRFESNGEVSEDSRNTMFLSFLNFFTFLLLLFITWKNKFLSVQIFYKYVINIRSLFIR